MKIEKIMMMIVGTMVLVSVALGYYVSATWLLLTAFIGVNLLISAFTGFCPMVSILRKFGLQHGCAFRGCAR